MLPFPLPVALLAYRLARLAALLAGRLLLRLARVARAFGVALLLDVRRWRLLRGFALCYGLGMSRAREPSTIVVRALIAACAGVVVAVGGCWLIGGVLPPIELVVVAGAVVGGAIGYEVNLAGLWPFDR